MEGLLQNPVAPYVPAKGAPEAGVQRRVCTYLRARYPLVYFRCDTVSGLLLSKNQRELHHAQQSGPCQPDLMIFEARHGYHGLLLEIKAPGTRIRTQDGALVADPHIRAQAAVISDLRKRGYLAAFAIGYERAIAIIDKYMDKPQNLELPISSNI